MLQVETNVKLEECLKKVQQENEDYKARMDKHAALSKYVTLLLCLRSTCVKRLPRICKNVDIQLSVWT